MQRSGWTLPIVFVVLRVLVIALLAAGNFTEAELPRDARGIKINKLLGLLFERIAKEPTKASVRREMAGACSDLGYRSVGKFFLTTAEYLEGKEVLFDNDKKSSWFCSESPEEARSSVAFSSQIDLLIRKGEYRLALSELEERLKSRGFGCRTMVDWSRAVVVSANQNLPESSYEREELAVRWLLTAAEEINIYAFNLEGKATTYNFLSDYFLLKKDYVSAYISTLLAMKHLRSGDFSLVDESRLDEKLRFLRIALEK